MKRLILHGLSRSLDILEPSSRTPTFLLLPPAPAGSLGDQAMVDAAATQLDRMGWRVKTAGFGARLRCKVETAPIGRDLRKGQLGLNWQAMRAQAAGFVGADVVDGVYAARSVVKTLDTLAQAHRAGRNARVFGSSWSQRADAGVVDWFRANPWLTPLSRDPESARRFQTQVGREPIAVADLAFDLRPELESPSARAAGEWIDARAAAGDQIAGFCFSGHSLLGTEIGVKTLAQFIEGWLRGSDARAALLLAHDFRGGKDGDVALHENIAAALPEDLSTRVRVVEPPFEAWDVKHLAGKLSLVFTGRMHFAIAALGMSVPALTLVYQGKFEGMLGLFGLEPEDYVVDPVTFHARFDEALGKLERLSATHREVSARIAQRLPEVKAASARNFEGLRLD